MAAPTDLRDRFLRAYLCMPVVSSSNISAANGPDRDQRKACGFGLVEALRPGRLPFAPAGCNRRTITCEILLRSRADMCQSRRLQRANSTIDHRMRPRQCGGRMSLRAHLAATLILVAVGCGGSSGHPDTGAGAHKTPPATENCTDLCQRIADCAVVLCNED